MTRQTNFVVVPDATISIPIHNNSKNMYTDVICLSMNQRPYLTCQFEPNNYI